MEVQVHKTSLAPPLFIGVPVPCKKGEQSCICMLVVSIMSISPIFLLDFITVTTVLSFYFQFYTYILCISPSSGRKNSELCKHVEYFT